MENIILKHFLQFSAKKKKPNNLLHILLSAFSLTGVIARLGSSRLLVLLQEAMCAAKTKITRFYNLPYESASLLDGLCLQHRNHHLSLPSRQHHAMNIHE